MSQFSTPGYDIQRPTGVCAYTGRKLEPGEQYIAALLEVTPGSEQPNGGPGMTVAANSIAGKLGFKRLDVSLEVWKEGKRPEGMFSYWKSTVQHPNQKKKMFVDDEVLLTLFKRLADDTQPQRQGFRFVLALILMRKKLLRFEGQTEKEVEVTDSEGNKTIKKQEWWDMLPKGEDKPLGVLNPHMDEAQIREVTAQLGEVLEGNV
jgi:hypothetical protein